MKPKKTLKQVRKQKAAISEGLNAMAKALIPVYKKLLAQDTDSEVLLEISKAGAMYALCARLLDGEIEFAMGPPPPDLFAQHSHDEKPDEGDAPDHPGMYL